MLALGVVILAIGLIGTASTDEPTGLLVGLALGTANLVGIALAIVGVVGLILKR